MHARPTFIGMGVAPRHEARFLNFDPEPPAKLQISREASTPEWFPRFRPTSHGTGWQDSGFQGWFPRCQLTSDEICPQSQRNRYNRGFVSSLFARFAGGRASRSQLSHSCPVEAGPGETGIEGGGSTWADSSRAIACSDSRSMRATTRVKSNGGLLDSSATMAGRCSLTSSALMNLTTLPKYGLTRNVASVVNAAVDLGIPIDRLAVCLKCQALRHEGCPV